MVHGISVVIPNYNGINLFAHTLPTVVDALRHSGKPYEIILVDDCSTDASVAYIRSNYPQIQMLRNKVNSGFSVTANRGIRAANFDKVLLLNSDVQLTRDYFSHQYKYFDKPGTFGVMGRIVGWHDDIIQDGAKYPVMQGAKIKTSGNYLMQDEALMQNGLYSMYLSGANAFLDKEKFLRIGGLNELFSPFYVEDYELSLRAWRLGYTCYYEHASICRHQVSTSIKSKSKKAYINTIYNRNKMFLHAIHLEGAHLAAWYAQLVLEVILRLLTFRLPYLKAFGLFLGVLGQVREAKQALKKRAYAGKLRSVKEIEDFILREVKGEIIRF